MKYNLHIILKNGRFLNETLVYYGILVQNNQFNTVKTEQPVAPYYSLNEGIIIEPEISNKIRNTPNVICFKNNRPVLVKVTENSTDIEIFDTGIYDLYDESDYEFIDGIIKTLESERLFYSKNTESLTEIVESNCISGCASGYYLAQIAFRNKLKKVIYLDYSEYSLSMQKQLVDSKDRKQLLIDNLSNLTVGHRNTELADLELVDFAEIDSAYNYLQTIEVEYYQMDFRNVNDLHKLSDILPNNSTLWISNALHYITSLRYYDVELYNILDNLSTTKEIKILPHTRIYYESQNNLSQ